MVSSLIIKIRRRKESDIHIKFFIEGTYENLKQLKYHYYYHLCREDKNYDNKDNDDSCQYIKSHDDDILCMISNDIKSFYKCQENNCNQSFDSLIKLEQHKFKYHQHQCITCKKSFITDQLLSIHISENHDSYFQLLSQKIPSYICLVQKCNEKFWTNEIRREHLIQTHLYPSDFHFLPSTNNKIMKKIKKKINKNLHKNENNHTNGDSNTTFTTACIGDNEVNCSTNDKYSCGMIKDDNTVNPNLNCSSSNSKNCNNNNNNRKQRRKQKSDDKSKDTFTENPPVSNKIIESIIISSSSSWASSSSSFISSSSPSQPLSSSSTTKSTNKTTLSNSLIETNNNMMVVVNDDDHIDNDAFDTHENDDDHAHNDDEMDVVTEAFKKNSITVPSKIRFGRKGR